MSAAGALAAQSRRADGPASSPLACTQECPGGPRGVRPLSVREQARYRALFLSLGVQGRRESCGCVRPHLHTYSSRGGWVLGVMIQGAMRKATVSVKRGTSGRVWGENGDSVGPGAPAPGLPALGPPLGPEAPRPRLCPRHRSYLGVHQADAEGDQPREISVGKAEPLHAEADLSLPGLTGHFVRCMLGPQHRLVVQDGIPT